MREIKRGKKKRRIHNGKSIGTSLTTKESIIMPATIRKANQERIHHTKNHEIFLNNANKAQISIRKKTVITIYLRIFNDSFTGANTYPNKPSSNALAFPNRPVIETKIVAIAGFDNPQAIKRSQQD